MSTFMGKEFYERKNWQQEALSSPTLPSGSFIAPGTPSTKIQILLCNCFYKMLLLKALPKISLAFEGNKYILPRQPSSVYPGNTPHTSYLPGTVLGTRSTKMNSGPAVKELSLTEKFINRCFNTISASGGRHRVSQEHRRWGASPAWDFREAFLEERKPTLSCES